MDAGTVDGNALAHYPTPPSRLPPPRTPPVRRFGSSPRSGSGSLMRGLRCGKESGEGTGGSIGGPGSVISVTIPVKTAPYCHGDWHGGLPDGDTAQEQPHVFAASNPRTKSIRITY